MSSRPGEFFTWREFGVDGSATIPRAKRAAIEQLVEQYLDPLRREFGVTLVHSALRSPRHNRQVGGAPRSSHLTTAPVSVAAADVSCARGRPGHWFAFLDELGAGGLGLYPTHVHCDTRPGRFRW